MTIYGLVGFGMKTDSSLIPAGQQPPPTPLKFLCKNDLHAFCKKWALAQGIVLVPRALVQPKYIFVVSIQGGTNPSLRWGFHQQKWGILHEHPGQPSLGVCFFSGGCQVHQNGNNHHLGS